jgi:hypothetical protein
LKQEIETLLKQAEDVDATEDGQYGPGGRGSGEVWAVDTSWLRWWKGKIWLNPVVDLISKKLEDYCYFFAKPRGRTSVWLDCGLRGYRGFAAAL